MSLGDFDDIYEAMDKIEKEKVQETVQVKESDSMFTYELELSMYKGKNKNNYF